MEDEVSKVIRDFDAAHPYWREEKRQHEIKAAGEAEDRTRKAREERQQVELQRRG
jgi:hypothetical protein